MEQPLNVENAVASATGIRRPYTWTVVAAAMAGLLFGFDTAVIAGVITPFAAEFGLGEAAKGVAVSSALLGTLLAAMSAGLLGDRYGSRTILRMIGLAFIVSAVGCALAPSFTVFVAARFLGGLAIGGSSVLAPVFIAEVSPAERRGRLVGLFQVSIVNGILAAYVSNGAIDLVTADPAAWRWKMAVLAVPGIAFALAMLIVPHSPRWLSTRRRLEEADAVAAHLDLADWPGAAQVAAGSRTDARLNFVEHRRPILLAIALASFNQLSGINAILYYLNDIFAAAGFAGFSGNAQAVAIGATNLIATLAAMLWIDRLGRRFLLLCGAVGTALALTGIALIFGRAGLEWLLLPLLILFITAFALSQGAVIWVYLSEIFPNDVRGRGQALGSSVHWLWATILTFAFPVVAVRFNPALPFWIFAAATAVQLAVVWRYFPETKQASLEALDDRMRAVH